MNPTHASLQGDPDAAEIGQLPKLEYSISFHTPTGAHEVLTVDAEGEIAKRVAGLRMIIEDLDTAAGCIRARGQHSDEFVRRGLWQATIAAYGRCFVSASATSSAKTKGSKSGGRGTSLNDTHVADEYRASHANLMRLRHQYAAHAGDNRQTLVTPVIALQSAAGERMVTGANTLGQYGGGPNEEETNAILTHIAALRSATLDRYYKAIRNMLREYQGKPIDDLYAIATVRKPEDLPPGVKPSVQRATTSTTGEMSTATGSGGPSGC